MYVSSDFWGCKGVQSPILQPQSSFLSESSPRKTIETYSEFTEWLYDQQEFKYFIGRLRHHGLVGSLKYMWRCAMRSKNGGVMGTVYNNDKHLMSFVKQYAPNTVKLASQLTTTNKYWFRLAVIDYLLSDVPIWMINWGKSQDGRTFQVSFFPEVEMRS